MKQAVISASATTAVGSCIYLGVVYGLGADPVFAANILLTLMCGFSWVFTFLYGFRSQWNLTEAGRTLMYLSLSFSLVLTQTIASVWSHSEYPAREIIRFIVYFVLAAALLNMVRRVLIEQALDEQDRNNFN
ncbi:hypothetical protein SEA_ERUTAN_40 [Gordonia phage Erutan]|uniref:Holin n=1 Tax=Gordonia phage Erutan TaxID=3043913 RepID=A0AA96GTZ6_9CAUD|nr:hypothetical protein SEA_ERUTAN_40 [Gordonia phage Erutan]